MEKKIVNYEELRKIKKSDFDKILLNKTVILIEKKQGQNEINHSGKIISGFGALFQKSTQLGKISLDVEGVEMEFVIDDIVAIQII
jgi:hypothetical protein